MSVVDSLTLRFGPGSTLTAALFVGASLGLVAILLSSSGWVWKLGAISVLFFSTITVHAVSSREAHSGTIKLLQDGSVQISRQDGSKSLLQLKENAWVARWLCVLRLFEPDSGRLYHCVVCASENRPGEYRRLVKFLRMRGPKTYFQKATW